MKIIQINASYKPAYIYGGPTMSVSELSEGLVKAGYLVEVLTTTANGEGELPVTAGETLNVSGVPVTYFRRITKGNSHFSPALLLALWKKLKSPTKLKFPRLSNVKNIVHIHAWWNFVSVGSCIIALILKRPIILSPRGTLSQYSFGNRSSFLKSIFHTCVGRILLENCHFHVSTEKEMRDINNLVSPKSIAVIPNFVKLPTSTSSVKCDSLNEKQRTLKLLFLSRIEEKKGLDVLFKSLSQIDYPFFLTIAGSGNAGYIEYLKALAADLKLSRNICWIGQQDYNAKFKLLAENDIMILASHDESFGNVVIESLSVGTAVIISKNVGLSDYVSKNNWGWTYDSTNEGLKLSLISAFQQSKTRDLIREDAPQHVAEDFSYKNLIMKYKQLYDSV